MTTIHPLPQLLFNVASKFSWEHAATLVSTVECGFYSNLRGGIQSQGKIVNWLRETSIAQLEKIQVLFNCLNAAVLLYSAKGIIGTPSTQNIFWKCLSTASVLGNMTVVLASFAERYFSSLAETREINHVAVSEIRSRHQKAATYLHAARLVTTVSFAYLSAHPAWLALSLLPQALSFVKNLQSKWVHISRSFSFPESLPNQRIYATYKMFTLPPGESAKREICPICLDEGIDMTFCANHVFHQACMVSNVVERSSALFNNATYVRNRRNHYENRLHTRASYSYEFTLEKENLPSCPTCRDTPVQNGCDVVVYDAQNRQQDARVYIKKPPLDLHVLFDTIYALYNTMQAGLAYLQTYPELTATIFKVQRLLLVTDFAGYALSAAFFYKKFNEKYNPKNTVWIKAATCGTIAIIAALSYFAINRLNDYLKPAKQLKKTLAELSIPIEVLKEIELRWNSPLSHKLLQCLTLNRLIMTGLNTLFSPARKASLLSLGAQALTLAGLSNLCWIEFSQTLTLPYERLKALGADLNFRIKRLEITTYSLIEKTKDLSLSLKSIYTSSTSLLQNSSWNRYWRIIEQDGYEVGRRLMYEVTLQNKVQMAFSQSFLPRILAVSLKAIDSVYGRADVTVLTNIVWPRF